MHISRSFTLDAKAKGWPSAKDMSPRSTTVATSTTGFSTATKQMLVATILVGGILIIGILIYVFRFRQKPNAAAGTTPVRSKPRCVERDAKPIQEVQEKRTVLLTNGFQHYPIHSPGPNGFWAVLQPLPANVPKVKHPHSSPDMSATHRSASPYHFRPDHAALSGFATPPRKQQMKNTGMTEVDVGSNSRHSGVSSMTHESTQLSYLTANDTQTTVPTSYHLYQTPNGHRPVSSVSTLHIDEHSWPQVPRPAVPPLPRPVSHHSSGTISTWLRTHPHKPLPVVPPLPLRTLKNQASAPVLAPSRRKLYSYSSSSTVKYPRSPTSPTMRNGRGSRQHGRPPIRRVGTLSSIFRPASLKSFRTIGSNSHSYSHSTSSRRASTVASSGWI